MNFGMSISLFRIKPVARFEIIDRADPFLDFYRIAYGVYYRLRILIRHGAFVEGVGTDGGGENALHGSYGGVRARRAHEGCFS